MPTPTVKLPLIMKSYDGSLLPEDPTGFKNLGAIINRLLPYIYVFAGIALLLMLIAGGISLMTAAGDEAKTKAAYGRISGALIGFFIVFLSYFVVQLVEVILGVTIF